MNLKSLTSFAIFFALILIGLLASMPARAAAPTAPPATPPQTLKVAVVQTGLNPTLAENRDKIVRLIGEAAATRARLVVFPEGALAAPLGTPPDAMPSALSAVSQAAAAHGVYVVVGAMAAPEGKTSLHNQLYVIDPRGKTLLVYDKVWHKKQFDAPALASIDGIPCGFILCADRWSRPVESLPPLMGARILIECSGNFDNEWIAPLEWYWYVPRALRNTAFVIFANASRVNEFGSGGARGHGHSAVIAPDGAILAAADTEAKIITAELDLAQATRAMATRRSEHPLFKNWWAMGQAIHGGKDFPAPDVPELQSSENSVKCGFGLLVCTPSITKNVQKIVKQIGQAAAAKMDLVVFPELALTGDRAADIQKTNAAALDTAVSAIREAARKHQLAVVFGAPSFINGKRRNSAYAIGPDGAVLTRYDQIVVGRPDLFEGGLSTRAMWFQVRGVWSIITIGEDALWNEMAELAALRGARLHCHLSHDRNLTPADALRHDQLVAGIASFRTLTVVANPLFPELRGLPDACFSLGSGVWDDLEAPDWCAVKTVSGRPWEGVYSAPRLVPGPFNPLRRSGSWLVTVPRYHPWMLAGAAAMDQ